MHGFYNIFAKVKSSSGFLLIIILTFIYFSFYAVKGERGFLRYVYLTDEVKEAHRAAEKSEWESKVKLLSPESLDLDMLNERAHIVLNMVGKDEFIILDEDDIK